MRTVVNVQAGGKTPLSGIIHALVLLLVVFCAGPLTAQIPNAVLAIESIVEDAVWIVVTAEQVQQRINQLELQRFCRPHRTQDESLSAQISQGESRLQALESAFALIQLESFA
ncbi:SulP family inorganic anion transporter [Anabaena sp. WFMT]|uniref:SulP family inorganic anion transporter n=1 Tax=Anabaena sp. WFMT TaxID=3449730 RepID=UPI003F218FC4